jgi:hypothetical protein
MVIFELSFRRALIAIGGVVLSLLTASGAEKGGMPDLGQEEQTCLPTSTANLIVWFGTHGYPKLIVKGDSADDGYIHTVHAIMNETDASYQTGTRTDAITYGIEKYIKDAGYSADVEYRGLDWGQIKYTEIVRDDQAEKYGKETKPPSAFTQDWLQENDQPNKGFILLLAYITFNQGTDTFSNALNAGHAVTLVNAEPNMLLIHDPAHYNDEPGRKILTPEPLTGGTFQLHGYNAPVSGLLLLSGSLLEAPPDAGVMLTGAVCVTMHPTSEPSTIVASAAGAPNSTIGGSNGVKPSTSPGTTPASVPVSTSQGWATWLFDLVFKS